MNEPQEKNNNIRYPQSGVIPFQIKKKRIKILLVTSLKSKQWIFPKGIIENHLTPQESALREAEEEAGVGGEVLNIKLGEYSYLKWGGMCEVEVFPMHVTRILDDWPEADLRLRKWVSLEKALNLINKKELRDLIIKFEENTKKILSVIANSS